MSAVIRACAILARSFDSGSGHAGLGIPHQDALEASVAARTEHDAMRAAIQSAEQRELAALAELDERRAELAAVQEVCSRQLDVLIERTEALESAQAELAVIRQHRDTLQDAWEQASELARRASQSGDQIAPDSHEPAENTGNPR